VCSTAPTDSKWFAINNVTFRRATAGDITAGKLTSVDSKTYFDLDNSVLATSNAQIQGGSIKIGDETYYTQIDRRALSQHLNSGGTVGGLVISGADTLRETLYCEPNNEVAISRRDSDGFTDIALFTTQKIVFTTGGEDKLKITSDFTPIKNIQYGRVNSVTTTGTSVSLSGFSSKPIVICTPLQAYAGNSHFIVVNVTEVTNTSFTVKTKDVLGDYASDIMWIAIGE
jgi:hypothetical protein